MEGLARTLERSGGYRVLRRLDVPCSPLPDRIDHRLALIVDVETTGLSHDADEIIQFAAVPVQYDRLGHVVGVHEPIDELRDPGRPIPPEITRLTGIDDDMVRGKAIDSVALGRVLSVTSLVIAHNASFDRGFLERFEPLFRDLPWACSMTEVPWRDEGLTTLKLEVLAMSANLFFDAHRALDDCLAVAELLRRPLPRSGRVAMSELLARARRETFRVSAVRAPFECKDILKARGYRWRVASGDAPAAWTIEVYAEALDDEIGFLREQVFKERVDPPVTRLSAYTRHSNRA